MHQRFIVCKTVYDSVRMEVLCNITIEYDIRLKLVRLINVVSELNI